MRGTSICWSRPLKGLALKKPVRIVGEIEKIVRQVIPKDDLEELVANIGMYYGDAGRFAPNTGSHTAFVIVNLVSDHKGHSDEYIARLRQRFHENLPGVDVAFQTGGIISDVLNFGLRAPMDIQVRGPSLDLIRPVAEAIQQPSRERSEYRPTSVSNKAKTIRSST